MNGAISVVIPAYNRAGLIGMTLRSLLNQTVPAKEIVVVDDGSTDSTAEVVESEFAAFSRQFAANPPSAISQSPLPRLRLIRQENAGPGAARNRGLAESTGEFVHFFDSDDIAAPNKQEVQLRALQENGADIAYGPWVKGRFADFEKLKDGNSETLKHRFDAVGLVLQAKGLPEGDLVKALLTDWSIVPHACLFRRAIVEKVGGFPEDIWVGEDQLMFLRCLLAGAKVVHTSGTLTYYRAGGEGKLTSVGEAQTRVAKDYARFLLKAKNECSVFSVQCSAKPNTHYPSLLTRKPSSWFGFRLRAYEAWKDLEKFFPSSEEELKAMLSKVGRFEGSKVAKWKYEAAGWWGRKLGGLRKRLIGYREHRVFRCGRYAPANFEGLTEVTK